jgi:ABC-type branched-subunit amino acid transport system ATPase component/ABC-type branched-subunit amino acid transport system permease subunit
MSSGRLRALASVFAPSAALLAVAILGLLVDTYWQYVLAISMSAAVVGAALIMLVGYARCITIATGAMLAIGAYGAALPVIHLGMPFLLALTMATVLGALAGLVLAIPGVRFRSHNLAMVTLVFQAVVIIVLRESTAATGGAEGTNVPTPVIFGYSFAADAAFLLLSGALYALIVIPMSVLLFGPFGKNLRALASNENAARAFGIDVRHHLIAAFIWSSALIAFAGAVSAPRFRIIDPDSYGILTSIFALAYPIIGGMGSIWGGLIGGGLLRSIPELLRPLADYIELIFCVLVVGTLAFFPDGLISALFKWPTRKSVATLDIVKNNTESQSKRISRLLSATEALGGDQPTQPSADAPILEIRSVSKSYGALQAVNDVSLNVEAHSLHGLMGPNGAGKTTLFNMVSGFTPPDAGQILLMQRPVDDTPLEKRITLGMTRTFQHASVFPQLSCLDNALIGLGRNTIAQGSTRSVAAAIDAESVRLERYAAIAALDAVGLVARAQDNAGALSLGDQRRLEIARAIVSRPRIILFDEPVSGVSHEEAKQLRELLLALNGELGITMVVIEHNIRFLVSLCKWVSVMSEGKILAEGGADAMVNDARVRQAYFGEQEAAE